MGSHQNSGTQGTARCTDTAKEHTTIFQSARDDGGDIFIAEESQLGENHLKKEFSLHSLK